MSGIHRLTGKELRSSKVLRRVFSSYFALHKLSLPSQEPRIACVVSKKVSPKAVERNKLKRQSRALLREVRAMLPGGAYLLHVKAAARGRSYDELRQDLRKLLAQA